MEGGRRPAASLPHKLEELQRRGRCSAPLFTSVPHSGLTPIEAALDAASDLKSVVLLGFTRDGAHLVSYTTQPVAAADGQEGYCLQLWSFAPGCRCRRLWNVPLFRVPEYVEALADDEGFLAADDMLLTVSEPPDGALLVVHGRSSDPGASRDHLPAYLTLIPGTPHAGAVQLQVAHLSYHTAFPHAPFNPYHCLAPLADGRLAMALFSGDGVRYVHAAAARQAVQQPPAAQQQQPQQRAQQPQRSASSMLTASDDGEEYSSSSHFQSPEDAAAGGSRLPSVAAAEASSPQRSTQQQPGASPARSSWPPAEQRAASPAGSPWPRAGRRVRQRPPPSPASDAAECELGAYHVLVSCAHACGRGDGSGSSGAQARRWGAAAAAAGASCAAAGCAAAAGRLDVEGCLYAALQQRGLPPSTLLDYATAPVQGCCWQGQDGLLLLAVLRLARHDAGSGDPAASAAAQQSSGGAPLPSSPRPGALPLHQATRSACVLLHAAAASGAAAVVEWLEPPYPWHDDLSAFLVQQTAFAGLAFEKAPAFFADFMRSRWGVPPPRAWHLPHVLSNRSVLGTGQSLQHLAHPWLPQALLGYGAA